MLDDLGFHRLTYDELLTQQETRARQLFGEDISTAEETALGKYIRLNVYDYSRIYEQAEKVYYGRFPDYATGYQLDRLCPFANISRNPATAARHIVRFTGTSNQVIPIGTGVSTEDGLTFITLAEVTIGDNGFGQGTAVATVECTEFGTVGNVEVGEIDRLTNPNGYVNMVEHLDIDLIAHNAETDKALRARFHRVLRGAGSGTYPAIYGALSAITNVDGVVIVENDTDSTDAGGRPPHSFQCYLVAPATIDQQIGEAIFRKKPCGIKPVGEVEVEVLDEQNNVHIMRFSRAIQKDVYIKATVGINTFFALNGEDAIKDSLAELINSLSNGNDVILSRMYPAIHAIEGVEEVSSLTLSTDGTTYSAANIICAPQEYARVERQNIELTTVQYVDL